MRVKTSVRGVFFDLYGTLLTYGDMDAAWSDWLCALYEGLEAHGLTVAVDVLAGHVDGFFAKPVPPPIGGLSVLERRISRLGEELGADLSAAQLGEIAGAAVAAWQAHISVDPLAGGVLRTLSASKRLALISNFDHPEHGYQVLQESGFGDLFEVVVFSGEAGVQKPDPAIFRIALSALDLEPGECVYVGDTDEDVAGAFAANIPAILIDRPELHVIRPALDFSSSPMPSESRPAPEIPPIATIASLGELLELVLGETDPRINW